VTRDEHKLIAEALEVIQQMPCGAIGHNGATEAEIDAAHAQGRAIEDDATYDCAQRVFLLLEKALGLNGKARAEA
jgi:hypothetical protein